MKYKCILIIVKVKPGSVGGWELEENTYQNTFCTLSSNFKITGFTRMLLEENSLLFWVYESFILVMMERKQSLITLWQLTISSTLYRRARQSSQIAPPPTESELPLCVVQVQFSNYGCNQAADRAEKSLFLCYNVISIKFGHHYNLK